MSSRFADVSAAGACKAKSRAKRGISPPEKETATRISPGGCYLCRRRPTLPHTFACSTIGPAGLDFRVRDGNGYFPRGKITGFVDVDAIDCASRSLSVALCLTQDLLRRSLKNSRRRLSP